MNVRHDCRESAISFSPDINECGDGNGGCGETCRDTQGSYVCECPEGYTLYTQNGTMGYFIPGAETGLRSGDTYYTDHTCVRKCKHYVWLAVCMMFV